MPVRSINIFIYIFEYRYRIQFVNFTFSLVVTQLMKVLDMPSFIVTRVKLLKKGEMPNKMLYIFLLAAKKSNVDCNAH